MTKSKSKYDDIVAFDFYFVAITSLSPQSEKAHLKNNSIFDMVGAITL